MRSACLVFDAGGCILGHAPPAACDCYCDALHSLRFGSVPSSDTADGLEQLGRLRPHDHRGAVPRQRSRAARQASALRLALRRHRRGLVLREPGGPTQARDTAVCDRRAWALCSGARKVSFGKRQCSCNCGQKGQAGRDDRGDELQAAGGLGSCAGTAVRHSYRSRNSTSFGRTQSADCGFKLSRAGCRGYQRCLPVGSDELGCEGQCSRSGLVRRADEAVRCVGRRPAQGRLHRRPPVQGERDSADSPRLSTRPGDTWS